eukprot:3470337-Pleurochrysis_carterae.AAC.1
MSSAGVGRRRADRRTHGAVLRFVTERRAAPAGSRRNLRKHLALGGRDLGACGAYRHITFGARELEHVFHAQRLEGGVGRELHVLTRRPDLRLTLLAQRSHTPLPLGARSRKRSFETVTVRPRGRQGSLQLDAICRCTTPGIATCRLDLRL